jgi:hypothetical protein
MLTAQPCCRNTTGAVQHNVSLQAEKFKKSPAQLTKGLADRFEDTVTFLIFLIYPYHSKSQKGAPNESQICLVTK